MNEVQHVTEVAKGISDYGILIMIGAAYLILSVSMMVAIFKWFKSIINQLLEDSKQSSKRQQESWKDLLAETRKQNEMLTDLSEGLRTETQLRIRNLSGFAFDLSVEQVCRLIKKIREENHIADKEATREKIRKSLSVMHEDRKSRFDPYTYRGKPLSGYCNSEWIERVAKVVEAEIYSTDGQNNGRAYTNVKLAYDDIKTDFYHKLNS
ncbi:hypothetical protein [Bacteroides sp.]|uniref:hypothetical protein n=1 Tax=Bacteroides sp. TaxID=29523 RepID=UPI003AAE2C80